MKENLLLENKIGASIKIVMSRTHKNHLKNITRKIDHITMIENLIDIVKVNLLKAKRLMIVMT